MVFGTCPISPESDNSMDVVKNWDLFFQNGNDKFEEVFSNMENSLSLLITKCLQKDPKRRPSARNIMQSAYFDSLSGTCEILNVFFQILKLFWDFFFNFEALFGIFFN